MRERSLAPPATEFLLSLTCFRPSHNFVFAVGGNATAHFFLGLVVLDLLHFSVEHFFLWTIGDVVSGSEGSRAFLK